MRLIPLLTLCPRKASLVTFWPALLPPLGHLQPRIGNCPKVKSWTQTASGEGPCGTPDAGHMEQTRPREQEIYQPHEEEQKASVPTSERRTMKEHLSTVPNFVLPDLKHLFPFFKMEPGNVSLSWLDFVQQVCWPQVEREMFPKLFKSLLHGASANIFGSCFPAEQSGKWQAGEKCFPDHFLSAFCKHTLQQWPHHKHWNQKFPQQTPLWASSALPH